MVDGRLLAGIDIGTTGSRCMIFDLTGRCVASAYHDYPLMLETTMDMCQRAIREGGIDASRIAPGLACRRRCAARSPVTQQVSYCGR